MSEVGWKEANKGHDSRQVVSGPSGLGLMARSGAAYEPAWVALTARLGGPLASGHMGASRTRLGGHHGPG